METVWNSREQETLGDGILVALFKDIEERIILESQKNYLVLWSPI